MVLKLLRHPVILTPPFSMHGANFVMMLKVSVYMLYLMYGKQYHTSLHVMMTIFYYFLGSKELKDQLLSSAILRLWESGSRMYNNCREDEDIDVSIINYCNICI